ncbi:MAG: hypothetical protein M9894_00295 [Planctomycetes bacterium]|nr:hypothetical protein [Planctomycetota bacterium]
MHHCMELQGQSKCAFFERKLESVEHGRGSRPSSTSAPRGAVKPWLVPASLDGLGMRQGTKESASGYYLLAYHLFNYVASCIPCNSSLKGDYFPVRGKRRVPGDKSPQDLLAAEKPYLIYPIGDFDEDPEELITFHGISPMAKKWSGHGSAR